MEKINDILKLLIGIMLVFSFVSAFTSCEKKGGIVENNDTAIIIHKHEENKTSSNDHSDWKEKMRREGDEIDQDLEKLKVKAKQAGSKIEKEVNLAVDKLKNDKKHLSNDSTNSNLKEDWEKFKVKAKNAIDSINKKI